MTGTKRDVIKHLCDLAEDKEGPSTKKQKTAAEEGL